MKYVINIAEVNIKLNDPGLFKSCDVVNVLNMYIYMH